MMILGAILAATDPVAVGAIFKRFPILDRLNVIIEGKLPILLHEYLKKTKLASLYIYETKLLFI